MDFEEAFTWMNEHDGAVVRFFQDVHTGVRKIRISVSLDEDKDPVTVIVPVDPSDPTGMETFVAAVEKVAASFEAHDRRAQIRLVV